jgi:GT2 family glycosyltransferase
MEDTCFVVVNWNGASLLPACLDALARQTHPARVVVVDNGSTDASAAVVLARAGVEWLPLGRNTGFAGGANAGIRRALLGGGRFVALVNTDAVLAPDWLARLHAAADGHPEAGALCGTLVFADRPHEVNSTGLVMDGLLRARDRDFGVPLATLTRGDGPMPAASFGAVLLRASALRRVGLLDPAFFAYCEDADWSLRAAAAGVGAWWVKDAVGAHGYARTAGAGSPLQRYLLARNHLRVAARHLPLALALLVVPALAALRLLAAAPRELLRGRPAHALAQLRAARDGLRLAAGALRPRLGLRAPALPYPAAMPGAAAGAPWSAR